MFPLHVCSVCDTPVDLQPDHRPGVAGGPEGWRHLDDSPLCSGAVPTVHSGPGFPIARILSGMMQVARSQARTMMGLSQYLSELAAGADPADIAFAGRAGSRLAHAAALNTNAAADLAACWAAAQDRATAGTDRPCGCPQTCAGCAAALRADHGQDCPWRRGSVAREDPVIAPEPTVLPGHTHRPGCPQAVRRPGGLFEAINPDGDVQCLTCAAVNTMDGESFESQRGNVEHNHHRCTACGGAWTWCSLPVADGRR